MSTDLSLSKARLTAREEELILMSSEGKTDQEIAKALGLSKDTVNSYWKRILPKMGAASRTAAVATYWQTCTDRNDVVSIVSVSPEGNPGQASLSFDSLANCFGNIRAFSAHVLQALISISGAEFGFVGSIRYDAEGNPYLKEHAITDISWDDASRELFNQNFANGMEFRNLNTLFGEVMKTASLVVSNNPASDPRAGGLPPGHPPLKTFIGIPIHFRDEFVGMACLANRPGGFEPSIQLELGSVLSAYAAALFARKEADSTMESLHRSDLCSRMLSTALEDSEDGVLIEDESGTILFANEAFCKLFGLSVPPECLRGLKCNDLLGRNLHAFQDVDDIVPFVTKCLTENPNEASLNLKLQSGKECTLLYRRRSGREESGHCWTYRIS